MVPLRLGSETLGSSVSNYSATANEPVRYTSWSGMFACRGRRTLGSPELGRSPNHVRRHGNGSDERHCSGRMVPMGFRSETLISLVSNGSAAVYKTVRYGLQNLTAHFVSEMCPCRGGRPPCAPDLGRLAIKARSRISAMSVRMLRSLPRMGLRIGKLEGPR
jgi:hypothetical protein